MKERRLTESMRILIATDGGRHSDTALQLGQHLAQATAASVTLLAVVEDERERLQAEAILERAATLLSPAVEPELKIRVGQPAAQIVLEASETDPHLLILGERVHHGLAKRILAPTVERVIQKMPCPLLIAREQARRPRRLLVCEAGRQPSLLHRLAEQLGPLLTAADALTVLHVMSQMAAGPGVRGWALRADAEELMEEQTPEGRLLEDEMTHLEQLNVDLSVKVRHGLVVKEILKEARSGDYDLIVIGAHQGKRWERFLLDDLAQEIVDHADRPVLVV